MALGAGTPVWTLDACTPIKFGRGRKCAGVIMGKVVTSASTSGFKMSGLTKYFAGHAIRALTIGRISGHDCAGYSVICSGKSSVFYPTSHAGTAGTGLVNSSKFVAWGIMD